MARKKKNQYPVDDGADGGFVLILLLVIVSVLPYILAIGAIALVCYLGYVFFESFSTSNLSNDSSSTTENKTGNKLPEYKNLQDYTNYSTVDKYKKY